LVSADCSSVIAIRVGFGRIVGHALLEALDALGDVTHQIGDLATAEQKHDNQDHQKPVPNRKRTHLLLLP